MRVDLLERRLLFVTGKGGVGKSTIAAALGLLGAQQGKRTLVCEIDPKGNLAEFIETGRTTYSPREVQPGLFAMSMDTEAALQEYIRLQLKLPSIARLGPLARAFDFVAKAGPGVKEILTVGKPIWEVREGNYDLVIVDAAATGHIVSQLSAPQAIAELVGVGLVRQQTGWMLEILGDPARTGLVIVTTPEEMPVNETIELAASIEEETNVDLAGVIVNRVLPELFGRQEEEVFDSLGQPDTLDRLSAQAGGPVGPVLEAARLAVTFRRTRAEHLRHLRGALDPELPLLYVPYLFARTHGLRATRQVAEALGSELE